MQIAIVGAGRIGSTFAFSLARAGHDVTLVARGQRLAELQRDLAIESVAGVRATIKAAQELSPTTPWDLVLVTVLAHQVGPLLPALKACAARTVMFMFNTVAPLQPLRDAVGAARFAFAFPTVTASFVDGKLKSSVNQPGQVTTLDQSEWCQHFIKAGLPSVVEPDMESFLRSHAAFVIPLMIIGCLVSARGGQGIAWAEARRMARVMSEAFAVVRVWGNRITPAMVSLLDLMPELVRAALFWLASRLEVMRELGAMGPGEVRELIDAMAAAAPDKTPEMRASRP